MDRHATYVGLSRHRESMDLFWSKEAFAHKGDLVRTLSRERSKDISLDYSITDKAFATH
jgi:ATP-dependent exoDNAse (exonuclease V) alpha subunit